jgi:hypothetical protein
MAAKASQPGTANGANSADAVPDTGVGSRDENSTEVVPGTGVGNQEESNQCNGSGLVPTLFQQPSPVEYNETPYQSIGIIGRWTRRIKRRWHKLHLGMRRNSCFNAGVPSEAERELLERIHTLTLEIHPDRRTAEDLVGIVSAPLVEAHAGGMSDLPYGPSLFPDLLADDISSITNVTPEVLANSLTEGIDITMYRPSGQCYTIPFASVWLQDRMRYEHPGLPTTGNTLQVKMRNYVESLRKRVISVQSMIHPVELTDDEKFVRDHMPVAASTNIVRVAAMLYAIPTAQECLERDLVTMPAVRALRDRRVGLPCP